MSAPASGARWRFAIPPSTCGPMSGTRAAVAADSLFTGWPVNAVKLPRLLANVGDLLHRKEPRQLGVLYRTGRPRYADHCRCRGRVGYVEDHQRTGAVAGPAVYCDQLSASGFDQLLHCGLAVG